MAKRKRARILVVDDKEDNLRLMESLLDPLGCEVITAGDGEEALKKVAEDLPDVILLDIIMPKLNGFETVERLKRSETTRDIPVVMVTGLDAVEDRVRALQAGADDFLTKPVEATEFRARIQSLLKVKAYNDHMRNYQQELEEEVAKRTRELRQSLGKLKRASLETIYRLACAAEHRDKDTGDHIQRMSHYSAVVAKEIGLEEDAVEAIVYASPMHDVGKVGIPDRILLKPGKLNPDEWKIMKEHTIIGGRILERSDARFIKLAEIVALTHHEKWDGCGYPKGLKGKEIPIAGRITAIADVFDALTSRRPYKEPFSVEKSFGILREGRASHFDPDVVDAFFAVEQEILAVRDPSSNRAVQLWSRMGW